MSNNDESMRLPGAMRDLTELLDNGARLVGSMRRVPQGGTPGGQSEDSGEPSPERPPRALDASDIVEGLMEQRRIARDDYESLARLRMQERAEHAAKMQTATDTTDALRSELEQERQNGDDMARLWSSTCVKYQGLRKQLLEARTAHEIYFR